jgi:hypothetical protein
VTDKEWQVFRRPCAGEKEKKKITFPAAISTLEAERIETNPEQLSEAVFSRGHIWVEEISRAALQYSVYMSVDSRIIGLFAECMFKQLSSEKLSLRTSSPFCLCRAFPTPREYLELFPS